MERKIIVTKDGSHSISIPELGVTYHSLHGAIRESIHVFIEAGFKFLIKDLFTPTINILEMGFGSGLNAFLTAIESEKIKRKVYYTALEKFPIPIEEAEELNYSKMLGHEELFRKFHRSNWNEHLMISEYFCFQKENICLQNLSTSQQFNLIYYDAFAPNAQPELWTKEIFDKLFHVLEPHGVFVTYCSKGDVRRALIAAGFDVKKLPGPPGKREMLRAIKC